MNDCFLGSKRVKKTREKQESEKIEVPAADIENIVHKAIGNWPFSLQ